MREVIPSLHFQAHFFIELQL